MFTIGETEERMTSIGGGAQRVSHLSETPFFTPVCPGGFIQKLAWAKSRIRIEW